LNIATVDGNKSAGSVLKVIANEGQEGADSLPFLPPWKIGREQEDGKQEIVWQDERAMSGVQVQKPPEIRFMKSAR
jgi:hypothetical protein